MRRLVADTLDTLRARLAEEPAALPFAEAAVAQIAHPLPSRGTPGDEEEAAETVLALLAAPDAPGADARLAERPEALAAFFQNVDLLYAHGFPRADRVSLLIMRALEHAH